MSILHACVTTENLLAFSLAVPLVASSVMEGTGVPLRARSSQQCGQVECAQLHEVCKPTQAHIEDLSAEGVASF